MAYRDDILATSGLIGYWRFEETTGTVAEDETASNRDGTISGPTLAQAGIPNGGTSLLFDGADDVVTVPSHTDFDFSGTAAHTIEFWLFVTAHPATTRFIVSKNLNDGSLLRQGWGVRHHTSGEIEMVRYVNDVGSFDRSGVILTLNEWNHVAVTHDGTNYTVHTNGVAATADSAAEALAANAGNLKFGSGDNVGFFAGRLDEVALYNVALSAQTIADHHASGVATLGQKLYPRTDVSAGNWTTHLGATTGLAATLDEATADDADYVRSGESPSTVDVYRFTLRKTDGSGATDPGVDTGHVLRWRPGKSAAGGDALSSEIRIYDGVNLIVSDIRTNPDAFTTYTVNLTEVEAAAISGYGTLEGEIRTTKA